MSAFVGESRIRLVDGLFGLYEDTVTSQRSCWVSLEAPSGWGKTRVGREFYARLAAGQEAPSYWPRRIADGDLGRKTTYPAKFVRPAGSLPEFMWWGIACSTRQGVPTDALVLDMSQLQTHGLYVEAAWRASASVRERIGPRLAEVRRMFAKEGVLELVALGIDQIAGMVSPVLGLTTRLTHWTVKGARERQSTKRDIGSETVFGSTEGGWLDVVGDVVDLLSRLAGSGFPIVVMVEDVHSADGALLELLGKLLRREGSMLIVTTAWPDRMRDSPGLSSLLAEHESRLHRVDQDATPSPPFAAGAGLMKLEKDARAMILSEFYPQVETATRDALLERYVNPLALELFCQIRKYRHGTRYRSGDGALRLPAEELARLPRKVHDLYKSLWDELPRQIRLALAVADVITPASIDAVGGGGEDRWSDSLLRTVISNLDHPEARDVIAALDHAPSAYAWVRIVDDRLRAFVEVPHRDIARIDGYEFLEDEFDDPRGHILNALAQTLLATCNEETKLTDEFDIVDPSCSMDAPLPDQGPQWKLTPEATNRFRSILSLHAAGYITDRGVAAQAIAILLVNLAGNPRELSERIRLLDLFTQLGDVRIGIPHRIAFMIRHHGATALGESGEYDEAIAELETLIVDRREALGPDNIDTLNTRNCLAFWLSRASRVTEAIDVFEEVLDDRVRLLGSRHPDTLVTRYKLAGRLGEADQVARAIEMLEGLLEECAQVPNFDRRDVLSIRHERAYWLGKAKRANDALAEFERVLAERMEVSGPDHPHTLSTRHNLANQIGAVRGGNQAVDAYREVLVDHERVLGPENPQTLRVRHYLAYWLGQQADYLDEAIEAFEAVVADRARLLGPDSPETLISRHELAILLGRAI